MAYKNKEDAQAARKRWVEANREKVLASRQRWTEKRRELRKDPEYRAKEAGERRVMRRNMTPEQLAADYERRKKYQRDWHRTHYKERYARMKERMAADPEYAAKINAMWRRNNQKRKAEGKKPNETPEARERRLQRTREYHAKKAREKKMMAALTPAPPKPKAEPAPKAVAKKATQPTRKPGRLVAMAGWHRW